MSVVARPWFQDAPVARVAGWTGRTSEKPRLCDPTDRCTLDVHQSLTVQMCTFCRICHVGGFTMWYMHWLPTHVCPPIRTVGMKSGMNEGRQGLWIHTYTSRLASRRFT